MEAMSFTTSQDLPCPGWPWFPLFPIGPWGPVYILYVRGQYDWSLDCTIEPPGSPFYELSHFLGASRFTVAIDKWIYTGNPYMSLGHLAIRDKILIPNGIRYRVVPLYMHSAQLTIHGCYDHKLALLHTPVFTYLPDWYHASAARHIQWLLLQHIQPYSVYMV